MGLVEISVILSGAIIVLGTMVQALAQGRALVSALESIARQPEAAGPIGTNLIIGLAFIESLSIYVLVIALILLFADPHTKSIKDVADAKAKVEILELQLRQSNLQQQIDQIKPAE